MPFVHFVSQADISRHQGFLSTKQKNNIIQTTTHNTMKTTVIGRETPILTYQLFTALADRNERDARRKVQVERMKATVLFWKRNRDAERNRLMEQFKAAVRARKENA